MNLWSLFSGGHYTTVATFGGDSSLAAAGPLFFLQGAGPFRSSRFIAAFGRRSLLAAAGSICPCWGTLSPGRAAHPPAFALSGPYIRYLLAFPATGSGGHPCPYGASLGILPHVAYKAGVNTGGPRGAFKSAKPYSSNGRIARLPKNLWITA
jgi:hypothetical protein